MPEYSQHTVVIPTYLSNFAETEVHVTEGEVKGAYHLGYVFVLICGVC